ncbi:cytochrome P450 [Leucobacter massiliensis]|uniref:Cytochrome n=1 Tax=Leucobacter massiliensis TaxID=1686285 RepID=A0A2S9QQJ4_9MICO|nr:cytochrome P450 [Leucobacter massiliensis]PRI11863.1 hypothetical protein B4915_05385 [Leucobacter massiliensis]
MSTAPRVPGDATLAFLTDGYRFGHRRFERLGSDVFSTRLAGRPITFLRGQEAARFFGEADRFTLDGAMPRSVLHSLQDAGSVQTLSGTRHRSRKAAFLDALDVPEEARDGQPASGATDGRSGAGSEETGSPDGSGSAAPSAPASGADASAPAHAAPHRGLADCFAEEWEAAEWEGRRDGQLRLMPAAEQILCDAALRWLGIGASRDRRRALARECAAMIDGSGSFGPRNWRGRALRLSAERWARETVRAERAQPSGALARLLDHPELADDEVAAVELLNLIRPTVAVARFVAFSALALHLRPAWRARLREEPGSALAFAQEVRRTTPFFPAVAGVASESVSWRGHRFEAGDWVALDLFATNRHPGEWEDAWTFDPGRFAGAAGAEAEGRVLAQGAGELAHSHRCPGEPATVELLALATLRLAEADWSVPEQDLRVGLARIPARPGSAGLRLVWTGRDLVRS